MIKRLGKAKKGKQGAILIFVVLILALAMIFISAAMMLTNATRSRLYESTMQTQARLTVTSAVEVFLEALETQEITDDQLEGVIQSSHGLKKIKMVVDGVPGMSQDNAQNCTTIDIYYPNNSNHNVVNCDFTTIIGEETECVRVVLTANKSGPSYGSRFKNQVEVGSDIGIEAMRFYHGVGMVNPAITEKPTDNTIFLRGSGTDTGGGSFFYSDVVFANDAMSKWGSSNTFYGNIIFLDSFMYSGSNDTKYHGDIYFIGTETYTDTNGNVLPKNEPGILYKGGNAANQFVDTNYPNRSETDKNNFVFLNRDVQNSTYDDDYDGSGKKVQTLLDSKDCYFVVGDSSLPTDETSNPKGIAFSTRGGTMTQTRLVNDPNTQDAEYSVYNKADDNTDLTNVSAEYVDINNHLKIYSASDYCNANKAFPSTEAEVFKDFSPDGYVKAGPGGATLAYDTYLKNGQKVSAGDVIPEGTEYILYPLTSTYPSYKKVSGSIPTTSIITLSDTDLATKDTADGTTDGVVCLDPGYYYLKSGTGSVTGYNDKPYVIAINGLSASSYRFYFQGGTVNGEGAVTSSNVFKLGRLVFAVYNTSKAKTAAPVVFIMEPGAEIEFCESQYGGTSFVCSSGFVSVQHVDSTGAGLYDNSSGAAMGSYIRNTAIGDELTDWGAGWKGRNNSTITYPYAYDGVAQPCIFVYGTNGNSIRTGPNAMLEAYIGLYGNTSRFWFSNDSDEPVYLYGRIEAKNYGKPGYTGAPGALTMPYCPQPGNNDDGTKKTGYARSVYSVADLQYYTVLPA